MSNKPIAGKITIDVGITSVNMRVGAQTVRLTTEEATELAKELSFTASILRALIFADVKKSKA